VLHSSHESGEFSQCFNEDDDSTINIILVLLCRFSFSRMVIGKAREWRKGRGAGKVRVGRAFRFSWFSVLLTFMPFLQFPCARHSHSNPVL